VDVDVPVWFAWQYMTDVRNWNDPPAEFTLDGPLAAGTRGTTRMPGRPPNGWTMRDVDPGRGHTIEGGSFLEGGVAVIPLAIRRTVEHTTRLTQRLELCGENASPHVSDISSRFEPNLEPGLRRIAAMMVRAAQDTGHHEADTRVPNR
jgi:hypothetical protein